MKTVKVYETRSLVLYFFMLALLAFSIRAAGAQSSYILASGTISEITHLKDSVFRVGKVEIVVLPESVTHMILLDHARTGDMVEIVIRRK